MHKNTIIWTIVIVLIVGGIWWSQQRNSSPAATSTTTTSTPDNTNTVPETQVISNGTNQITITSGNLFYNPNKLTLAQNEPVTLTFTNTGFHTFTVDELNIDEPINGPSATIKFTPTRSGIFEYYCAIPGHREGGMVGTLTVQ